MLWSGIIRINKIIKHDYSYLLYVDVDKSVESFKKLSYNYKVDNKEIVLNVQINPHMLCNLYDRFKIKSTKKFFEIDFSNSNVYIKLEINDSISVKTLTKTENDKITGENSGIKWTNKKTNTSIRSRFTSDLIGICKKIND
jgi:hypothetical protein